MVTKDETKAADSDLRLELYKSLRTELVGYVEKVPAIWLQKFILVGAVIAFIFADQESLTGNSTGPGKLLVIAAIIAVPVLAVLLDTKIGEYGLHARSISRFIQIAFKDSVAAEWESTLWGDKGDSEIIHLVKLRSLMTAVVTAIPTVILIVVAGIAIDEVHKPNPPAFVYLSTACAVAYILGGIFMWRLVWPKQRLRGKIVHNPADKANS